MTMHPIYVPVMDCKEVFSISRDTIYRAANRGEITIHKAGGRSLLKVSEVCEWIEDRGSKRGSNVGQGIVEKSEIKQKQ